MSVSSSSTTETEFPAVDPRCRHFGECGGCRLQDISYEDQLAKKAGVLKELLARIEWQSEIPLHPSPEPWYYRNKMEFSFQDVYPVPEDGGDPVLLGLKVRNRWDRVMNLAECHLMSEDVSGLLESVHSWAVDNKLAPYNLHKHKGYLRHLVVRHGKNTGDRLVNLVTTEGELPKESFVEAVQKVYPKATILHGIHEGKSDHAFAEKLETLAGDGFLTEKVLGKTFRISPYAFFQTNTKGAEFLYGLIRDWVADIKPKTLLDLYCGNGGIALSLSDLAERVMGVEVIPEAVEDARVNAEENGVKNAEFMSAKVEDLLPGFAAQNIEVDVVIADPPRSGLHPTAVPALKELAPLWIVYVSCNPKAMVEDLRRLSELYDVRKVEGVDMFPHTDHMESVALLQRIY
jgi:23S rRNA (uracil-5-)-methyltransferase RumA